MSFSIGAVDADAEEIRARVGARIKQAREARGLTQEQLARLVGGSITAGYISRWERGVNLPSTATLPALAAALGVTIAWLWNDQNNSPG